MPSRPEQRTEPLTIQFLVTSLPVGGAEVLLLNLIKSMDYEQFRPEVICMKHAGELGETFAKHVPVHENVLRSKGDFLVVTRLAKLLRTRKTDAVVTVGAGDKMFWGRLGAKLAQVPVICSALHSTGWPDGVGIMNRFLTPINDAFIACADAHAEHLVKYEHFPAQRVHAIPNGVDTGRFRPDANARLSFRNELGIAADAKIVVIVAALREEKNHEQFFKAAEKVLESQPKAHFVIVGDGPEAEKITSLVSGTSKPGHFHLLGNRGDTERILAGSDVFCLTSKNEANPVSILEALACQIPAVAPNVGSIHENVIDGTTGYLTRPYSVQSTTDAIRELLENDAEAKRFGEAGREHVVAKSSLDVMVNGYQDLIKELYNQKAVLRGQPVFVGARKSESSSNSELLVDSRDRPTISPEPSPPQEQVAASV